MTTKDVEMMIAYHDKRVKEIWELFAATSKEIQELKESIKETDKWLKESLNESDKRLKESLKETDRKMLESDKRLSKKISDITDQWGRFVENFIIPGIPKVFQERGIPITQTTARARSRRGGETMEVDVLAIDGEYVLVVEAKNVLRPDDVQDHVKRLTRFKEFFPQHRNNRVMGAVAAIEFASKSDVNAVAAGLFVITLGNDTVQIANEAQFKPQEW